MSHSPTCLSLMQHWGSLVDAAVGPSPFRFLGVLGSCVAPVAFFLAALLFLSSVLFFFVGSLALLFFALIGILLADQTQLD